MGFRWAGFRRVRGQVCKRVERRLRELGIGDLLAYRTYLSDHAEEWQELDNLCRITISRFCRDQQVFRTLVTEVLPRLARQAEADGLAAVKVWSAGCGAGEEPYSLGILAHEHHAPLMARVPVRILATDSDAHQLTRARAAVYPASSLREVPPDLRQRAFEAVEANTFRLRARYRYEVEFRRQDLRRKMPASSFHLILCRNMAFTYFDPHLQERILAGLVGRLRTGGYLVVGSHEQQPGPRQVLSSLRGSSCIFGPKPKRSSGRG